MNSMQRYVMRLEWWASLLCGLSLAQSFTVIANAVWP